MFRQLNSFFMISSYLKPVHAASLLVTSLVAQASAAPLPAEQLLPSDTIALLCVPDCAKLAAAQRDAPTTKFWKDDAMARFREKFTERLDNNFLGPIERQLGIKAKDVLLLFQGQAALAITQTGLGDPTLPVPSMVLIVDTREKAGALKDILANVRTKLTESSHALRTDRIRDVEVVTVKVKLNPLKSASDASSPQGEPNSTGPNDPATASQSGNTADARVIELSFGQVDSLLLIGTCSRDLEKVLARIQGANVPTLAEKTGFDTTRRVLAPDAMAFGWTDMSALFQALTKASANATEKPASTVSENSQIGKLLPATGLAGLKNMAFAMRRSADGTFLDLFLAVPQDERKGIFKLISIEPKDASPPQWVPSDIAQFSRWRLDGQKAWAALESTMNEISPAVLDFLIDQLNEAMKAKDPAFDFRRYFVQNLGDDMVSYQKPPRDSTPQALSSPPAINMIASPKPEQLIAGIKAAMLLMPPPLNNFEFKEREFLGKRIYSVVPPSVAFLGGGSTTSTAGVFHMSAANGYLAFANDSTILEEFLRSAESRTRTLSELPGLNQALQLVGGTGSGFVGYQNEAETVRAMFSKLQSSRQGNILSPSIGPLSVEFSDTEKILESLADFTLLPPFDAVSKYFGMFVCAGSMSPEGYTLKGVFPTPPQLRQ